jgi:hypothetical protein
MLKEVADASEKLGAYARAKLAADLSDASSSAREQGRWQRAFTLVEAALTLQPRREDARRRIGELRASAPQSEIFQPDSPDEETLEEIRRLIAQAAKNQPNPKELAFKGGTLRARAWAEKYPLSLVFGALFLIVMILGLFFHAYNSLVKENAEGMDIAACAVYTIFGILLAVFGWFFVKRRIIGLIGVWLITLIEFSCFWGLFTGKPVEIVRPAFFLGCLPAFFLIILLLINTRRIIRHNRTEQQVKKLNSESATT